MIAVLGLAWYSGNKVRTKSHDAFGPGSVTDMLGALGQLVSLSGPRFCISEMRGLAQKLSEMVLLRVWSVEQYHLGIC